MKKFKKAVKKTVAKVGIAIIEKIENNVDTVAEVIEEVEKKVEEVKKDANDTRKAAGNEVKKIKAKLNNFGLTADLLNEMLIRDITPEEIQEFLKEGGDINYMAFDFNFKENGRLNLGKPTNKVTLLMFAVKEERLSTVKALLEAGADPTIKCENQETVVDYLNAQIERAPERENKLRAMAKGLDPNATDVQVEMFVALCNRDNPLNINKEMLALINSCIEERNRVKTNTKYIVATKDIVRIIGGQALRTTDRKDCYISQCPKEVIMNIADYYVHSNPQFKDVTFSLKDNLEMFSIFAGLNEKMYTKLPRNDAEQIKEIEYIQKMAMKKP